jgi:hypothetical protein
MIIVNLGSKAIEDALPTILTQTSKVNGCANTSFQKMKILVSAALLAFEIATPMERICACHGLSVTTQES